LYELQKDLIFLIFKNAGAVLPPFRRQIGCIQA